MRIIKKIGNRLKIIIKRILFHVYYGLKDIITGKKVIVNYWIAPKADPEFYNIGDDLNLVLVKFISGKSVIPYRYAMMSRFKKRVNYLCIGSIISQLSNEQAVVWGSGVLSPDLPLTRKPLQVLAVRGPLTREYLLKNGVDCPEVYGDPALLLPNYYLPATFGKKYKVGIIPHYRDKGNKILDAYKQEEDVYIFDVQRYGSYNLFIDAICACDLIVSSSLHGLIISDAYGVPNVWAEFSGDKIEQFKFEDYFLSVQRTSDNLPLKMDSFKPVHELLRFREDWQAPRLELDKLIQSCPF